MADSNLNEKSDEDLMEMYRLGNTFAFDILFQRHSGLVLGFLKKRQPNHKDVKDIFQDVFLKLHRSKHLYDKSLPFTPWLFSITRSVWLDSLKKKTKEFATESEIIEDKINYNNQMLSESSTVSSRFDLNLLNQLPTSQKDAINLRVLNDETFDEIAIKLSTTPDNARQLVSRGLKKLRDLLGSGKKE